MINIIEICTLRDKNISRKNNKQKLKKYRNTIHRPDTCRKKVKIYISIYTILNMDYLEYIVST